MLKRRKLPSSKNCATEHKQTLQLFAPENSSVAQGVLRVILEKAVIEVFSPNGGGVAIMLMNRSQIKTLTEFGICFEEGCVPLASQEFGAKIQMEPIRELPRIQAEYIKILGDLAGKAVEEHRQDASTCDILKDWVESDDDLVVTTVKTD